MKQDGLQQLVGHDIDTVSFVRDFVELRIDYSIVRSHAVTTGTIDDVAWRFGDPGSADVMCRYIGRYITSIDVVDGDRITMHLERGATFVISLRPEDRVGVEAAHLVPARPDGTLDASAMWIW